MKQILVSFLAFLLAHSFGLAASEKPIRIGLQVGVNQVDVSCGRKTNALQAVGGALVVNGQKTNEKTKMFSCGDMLATIGDKEYRGDLIVTADENQVNVINQLGIDDYLKGVLPREVVVTWAEESLRAQAVASRTYLASHLGRHKDKGFDLCSDVHCQVYGGVNKEHPKTNEAVETTKEEILVYNGKPIGAFFHSNCGGTTEQVSYVWGFGDKAYLPRRKCSFGTKDPRYHWKINVHDGDMLRDLKKKTKVQGDELVSLKVKKKSASGRAQTVTVKTNAGTYDLSGNEFRIALHPEKIRSTLWTNLSRKNGAYEFSGRGWGHGVGMCQWGAKGQAEQGKTYREILSFYYPHAKFDVWRR